MAVVLAIHRASIVIHAETSALRTPGSNEGLARARRRRVQAIRHGCGQPRSRELPFEETTPMRKAFLLFSLSAVVAGCASGASTPQDAPADSTHATTASAAPSHQHRTLKMGVQGPLTFQTLPMARCALHPVGLNDGERQIPLDADDNGIVEFFLTPPAKGSLGSVALDCTDDKGATHSQIIDVDADEVGAPSPVTRPAPAGRVRSALTGDLTTYTQAELVSQGYPPRPDAAKSPETYARWVKNVTQDYNVVSPRRASHPERMRRQKNAGPIAPSGERFNSNNETWSGVELTNPQAQFFDVSADWTVPTIQEAPNDLNADAAEWIGLDNGGNDLYQSGTDSLTYSTWMWPGFFTGKVVTYYTWVEMLPNPPYTLPNFATNPGNEMSVQIFLADGNGQTWFSPSGYMTSQDNSVWFMIYNDTLHLSYWGTEPASSYTGTTAEFIIERAQPQLADFGIASMHNIYYGDSSWGWDVQSLDYNGSPPLVGQLNGFDMAGNGQTFDQSFLYSSSPPGGGNILWVWDNYGLYQ
jgi:hypothetical protein